MKTSYNSTGKGNALEKGGSWTQPDLPGGPRSLSLGQAGARFFGLFIAVLLFFGGCQHEVIYIEGSRKIISIQPGSKIVSPSGDEKVLPNEDNGGSKLWWIMTDKYLIEIFELLGKQKPNENNN